MGPFFVTSFPFFFFYVSQPRTSSWIRRGRSPQYERVAQLVSFILLYSPRPWSWHGGRNSLHGGKRGSLVLKQYLVHNKYTVFALAADYRHPHGSFSTRQRVARGHRGGGSAVPSLVSAVHPQGPRADSGHSEEVTLTTRVAGVDV